MSALSSLVEFTSALLRMSIQASVVIGLVLLAQWIFRKLERKGAIAHEVGVHTFVFYPLVQELKATRSVTREFLDRVFGGSVAGLMAHLLKNEKIPRKEWEQIRKLIDEQKEK